MKTTNSDFKLIEQVKSKLDKIKDYDNSPYEVHVAGVLCKSNHVYFGMNLAHWFGPCAEQVAISNAIIEKEEILSIVCLNINNGKTAFCYPCGNCLQLFARHCQGIKIIVNENEKLDLIKMLPYQYKA